MEYLVLAQYNHHQIICNDQSCKIHEIWTRLKLYAYNF